MNKDITINIKKSRKKLKDKCCKVTKQYNKKKVTKITDNTNDKIEHENQKSLPEIKIEPIDFLDKIANEIDINVKNADSFNILDPSYFYFESDCYGKNSTYI